MLGSILFVGGILGLIIGHDDESKDWQSCSKREVLCTAPGGGPEAVSFGEAVHRDGSHELRLNLLLSG